MIDENLRRLGIETAKRFMRNSDCLLNIGCGDGTETSEFTKVIREVVGIDNSDYLLKKAKERAPRASFKKTNILQPRTLPSGIFDSAVSIRVLINLPTWELQQRAMLNIRAKLKVGGRYIIVEDSKQGTEKMDEMRKAVGLEPINSPHWNNLFFDFDKLLEFASNFFEVVEVIDFSLYYLLTRKGN